MKLFLIKSLLIGLLSGDRRCTSAQWNLSNQIVVEISETTIDDC